MTAAFVGPGTVTTALVAGGGFGTALLWIVPASAAVTFVLQEGAGRLAAVSGRTLGEVLPDLAPGPVASRIATALTLVAVVAGAAAFQVGNLLGAAIAVEAVLGVPTWWTVVVVADVAFLLLWFGGPDRVQTVLGGLVALMGFAFVADLLLLPVRWDAVAGGLVPSLPEGAALVAVGLLGTTVVPYNLFLHGSLVQDRGWDPDDVGTVRRDLGAAIAVGAALTGTLVVAGATVLGSAPGSAAAMATTLEPIAGDAAVALFGIGFAAAGVTSSVTAPWAASFAAVHVLDLDDDPRGGRFRGIWAGVLLVGAALAVVGLEPIAAILTAQAANGVLLPVVAVAVAVALNRSDLVGDRANGRWANVAAVAAVAVTVLLGGWLVWTAVT